MSAISGVGSSETFIIGFAVTYNFNLFVLRLFCTRLFANPISLKWSINSNPCQISMIHYLCLALLAGYCLDILVSSRSLISFEVILLFPYSLSICILMRVLNFNSFHTIRLLQSVCQDKTTQSISLIAFVTISAS